MPITFNCPCGKALRVADEFVGRRVKCPVCQAVATVPSPQPQFEVVEDESKQPPAPSLAPAAKPAARDDEDDEDARGYSVAKSKRDEDEDEPKPKKKPEFRKRARDDDDDDYDYEEERPRRRSRPSDPDAGKKLLYIIGGLLLAAAGIAIGVFWWQDGPHTGRRPYSGYILGACCLIVGLGTVGRGITGNFDDD